MPRVESPVLPKDLRLLEQALFCSRATRSSRFWSVKGSALRRFSWVVCLLLVGRRSVCSAFSFFFFWCAPCIPKAAYTLKPTFVRVEPPVIRASKHLCRPYLVQPNVWTKCVDSLLAVASIRRQKNLVANLKASASAIP